jgi:hypothetical protein
MSSVSLPGSLSRWLRELALCLRAPFVAFALASSSDGGWEAEILCFDTAVGDGEVVRGRLEPCLFLENNNCQPDILGTRNWIQDHLRFTVTSTSLGTPCKCIVDRALVLLFAFLNGSSD